jgi:DNA-binding CsgD family transcriptional regulator
MHTATSTTLDGIAAASRILLAPLDYGSIAEWQRATNDIMKPLLGADKASFMLPSSGERLEVYSDEIPSTVLRTYFTTFLRIAERRWGVQRRSLRLGAWNRDEIYAGHLRELYASEYWHEFLRPNRAFDTIGFTAPSAVRGQVVNLYFHHDEPRGPRFGKKGLTTIRALLPSFRAGVKAACSLMTHRHSLGAVLDALDVAVVIGNETGCVLHRNAAFGRLLAASPPNDRATLESAVLRVLCSSRMPAVHELEIHGLRYCLTVSFATAGTLASGDVLVVTVERHASRAPNAEAMRGRCGLTMRETQVADLLAQGLRNAEVAHALAMSEATARHHTERVMGKLGVHSRAAIAFALARSGVQGVQERSRGQSR